jgi:hypothetical protein
VARLKRRIAEHEARIAGRLSAKERGTLFELLRRLGS